MRAVERFCIHNQGLRQERFDQMHGNRGNGLRLHVFDAHARLHLDRAAGAAADTAPCAQACTAIDHFQPQRLPRVDQVRVANLLQVHAPQLGPTPRPFEEFARNAPQGVTRFDHIFGRRIGRQLANGHAARSR